MPFESSWIAPIYFQKMVHDSVDIQMAFTIKLDGPTNVSHVVAHVANGSEANEFLNIGFGVVLPKLMTIKFHGGVADLTLVAVLIMHLFPKLIPPASRHTIAKACAPRALRHHVDFQFECLFRRHVDAS